MRSTLAFHLDVNTVDWGVEATLVELKDIQLPDSMKRATARQAEAEREKRAKIINAGQRHFRQQPDAVRLAEVPVGGDQRPQRHQPCYA